MSNYQKKFTLPELYASGFMDGFLPNPSKRNKYKIIENNKGVPKLKNKISLNNLNHQLVDVIHSNSHNFKRGSVSSNRIDIYLIVRNEREYEQDYDRIVKGIKSAKATLSYVNMFTNELESALTYSMNCEMRGKNVPKLNLRINDLNEIKGMSDTQKRNLAYNVIESILFDDDFNNIQSWNSLKGKNQSGYARYTQSNHPEMKYRLWKTLKREYEERNK